MAAALPSNISSLSDAEKFELLDAIWADLEAHASTLSSEQEEELVRLRAFSGKRKDSSENGTPGREDA
jgi:hypothetical protein